MANKTRIIPHRGHSRLSAAGFAACVAFLFLILLIVGNAQAQPYQDCDQRMNEAPMKYLHLQQKYNYGVVYGVCTVGKNKTTLLLMLPLSNHGPLDNILGGPLEPRRIRGRDREAGVPTLFLYDDGCVVNGASLAIEKQYLRFIEIDQGGVSLINDFGNMARELASYPLTFLPPDKLMEVLKAKPVRQCHSANIK
jgi:hypothetical protein